MRNASQGLIDGPQQMTFGLAHSDFQLGLGFCNRLVGQIPVHMSCGRRKRIGAVPSGQHVVSLGDQELLVSLQVCGLH